jgi:hypothetical protein
MKRVTLFEIELNQDISTEQCIGSIITLIVFAIGIIIMVILK